MAILVRRGKHLQYQQILIGINYEYNRRNNQTNHK
jgi:hypothetical protein